MIAKTYKAILLIVLIVSCSKPVEKKVITESAHNYYLSEIRDFENIVDLVGLKCGIDPLTSKQIILDFLKVQDDFEYEFIMSSYNEKQEYTLDNRLSNERETYSETIYKISNKFKLEPKLVSDLLFNYLIYKKVNECN